MWDRYLIGWLDDTHVSQGSHRVTSRQIIIVLTLLGALFRFIALGGVRITHDLAWQGWEAARILSGVYPLIGQPSSVFLDNPPLMGYIQAIPLFFWRSPWSIFIFITALNTLAIPFIFAAVEQVFGRRVAVLSTLLFVINPWVAHFSRMTWTQGLLPFFLAALFWGWLPIFAKTNPHETGHSQVLSKRYLWGWVAFTAMLQTYIMAFSMLLPAALLTVIFWRKLPKKQLWIGVGLLSLSMLFYGWSVAQNIDQNSGKFAEFLSELASSTEEPAEAEPEQFLNFTDDAIIHAMRLITGRDFVGQDINGPDPAGPIPVPILSQIARWVLSAAFLAGLLVCLLKRSASYWVLLIWFFMPVGMMMVLPSSVFVHPHYLLFTLPAGGIIAALGLNWLAQQHQAIAFSILALLVLFGGQWQLSLWQSRQATILNATALGLSGLPLTDAANVGKKIRQKYEAENVSLPIRVVADMNDQVASSMSGMWVDSIDGLNQAGFSLINSEQKVIYILLGDYVSSNLGWHINPEKWDMVVLNNKWPVQILEQDDVEVNVSFDLEIKSEAGFTLLGYSTNKIEDTFSIHTYWRVDALHDERVEWFVSPFVHLIGADGQTLANQAPYGQWGYRWEVGDVYVNTMRFEQTDAAVKLGIGLFDPISGRTFMLSGGNGNTPRYEVDLP